MDKLNTYFKLIEDRIKLPESIKTSISNAEKAIKRRLKLYLKKSTGSSVRFCRQGSWALDTLIFSKKGYCDLDFGVRLYPFPKLSLKTIQNHIKTSLTGYDDIVNITCKDKCVRIFYENSFHIDITIYGLHGFDSSPLLGTKGYWDESDTSGLKKWFENKAGQKKGQLRRIIKYLKLWADLKTKKMPSGLCFTILATENFQPATSDFLSLKYTVKNMQNALANDIKCEMPVAPFDNLFENLTDRQINYFWNSLLAFSLDLNRRISTSKPIEAKRLLDKHFKQNF